MTAQPTVSGAPNAPGEQQGQSSGLDIKKVLQRSTSEVPIQELAKKGLKQVKVLNQGMITKLIAETVDRVIAARAEQLTLEEKKKLIQESKAQFDILAQERAHVMELQGQRDHANKKIEELTRRLEEKEQEVEELRGGARPSSDMESLMIALFDKLKERNAEAAQTGDISKLQTSIEGLAEKISRIGAGGGGAGGFDVVDKEALIERLFSRDEAEKAESNIAQVQVKQKKSSGVKSSLERLKALQKGGTKDGE